MEKLFDNLSAEKPISKIPESASEKENLFWSVEG